MNYTRKNIGLIVLGLVAGSATIALIVNYLRRQPPPPLVRSNGGFYETGFFGNRRFVTSETREERHDRKMAEIVSLLAN